MEGKKEALLAEALERGWEESTLHDKLTELESVKPRPYGTLQAVGIFCISTSTLILCFSITIIHDHWQTFPFLSLALILNAMPSFFPNLLLDASSKMEIMCWSSYFII